jgi:hypothetical protein
MGQGTPRRDRVLLLAASAVALGIVAASTSSSSSAFWPVVTCVAYALMCVTIHKIGREGSS